MKPVTDQLAARKRIWRFFHEPRPERHEVSRFITTMSKSASVYLFGGALRDISAWGSPDFNSDVDIVVRVSDVESFNRLLSSVNATRNKFGGSRVRIGRWRFDIWEVSSTWAFAVGAVEDRGPLSLLETTFFNWDAIIYDWQSGTLHHPQRYFSELSNKYLELVLEDNPNSVGALVRSFRMIHLCDEIVVGPRLSEFIKRQLEAVPDETILSYEARNFNCRRITDSTLQEVRSRAEDWIPGTPYRWLKKRQMSFLGDIAS